MQSTSVFMLNEKEDGYRADVYYCSYCGNKAQRKDIGSSHNHRWEEEIIYFCDCDTAKQEAVLKEEAAEYRNKVYYIERELKGMEKLTDNPVVNKIKFDNEVKKLKQKYSIE
ncbi:hypothetical protein [Paenibacillus medicaginis]|uniref:Phage protein n=1 Tax=Paenibacillus medicaginis TaxID=1470560 RepID=A0ABV5BUM6_9BACL